MASTITEAARRITADPSFDNPIVQAEAATCEDLNTKEFNDSIEFEKFPGPLRFANKFEEREYLKGRLALAFRLFGRYGFDEGVAGHITLRDPVNPNHF